MILTQQFAVKMHNIGSAFLQPASANIHWYQFNISFII